MATSDEQKVVAEIAAFVNELIGDDALGNELIRFSKLSPEERKLEHETHKAEAETARKEWLEGSLLPGTERYFFDPSKRFERADLENAVLEDPWRTHVHEWRTHIPDELRDRWAELSDETKQVAHYMAKEQADREVWE